MPLTGELRETRQYLLAEAERRRGIKPINPNHWHWKLYCAWLATKMPDTKPQLNFCHYWRVVLIIALPSLLWRRTLRPLFGKESFQASLSLALLAVVVGGIVTLSILFPDVMARIGLTLLALIYLMASIEMANYLWCRAHNEAWRADNNVGTWPWWTKVPYFVLCGVPGVALALLYGAGQGLLAGAIWLLDFELHAKLGRAILSLDAHPKRAPLLRGWVALGIIGVVALVADIARPGLELPGWWFWTSMAMSSIAGIFAGVIALAALGHLSNRRERAHMLAILRTEGFVDWLWESPSRMDCYGRLLRGAPLDEYVRVLRWGDLVANFKLYLELHPILLTQLPYIPREARPGSTKPKAPSARRNSLRNLASGTWAFLTLLWAGIVYLKKVGACPLLQVEGASATATTTTNEHVIP